MYTAKTNAKPYTLLQNRTMQPFVPRTRLQTIGNRAFGVTMAHVEQSAIHCDCSHLIPVLQKSPKNLLVQSLLLLSMYRVLEAIAYVTLIFMSNNNNNNNNLLAKIDLLRLKTPSSEHSDVLICKVDIFWDTRQFRVDALLIGTSSQQESNGLPLT